MTAFWIIFAVLAFLALVLFLPVSLQIVYSSSLVLRLQILFFSFQLVPKKKRHISLRHFSKRGLQNKEKKAEKKALRAAKHLEQKKLTKEAAKTKKNAENSEKKEKRSFSEILDLITAVLDLAKAVISRFSKHLGLSIKQLDVSIGSDEAAKTALLCGTVNSAVLMLVEFFRNNTRFDDKSVNCISIQPDFLSESCHIVLDIRFRLNLIAVLDTIIHALIKFIQHKEHISPSSPKDADLSS